MTTKWIIVSAYNADYKITFEGGEGDYLNSGSFLREFRGRMYDSVSQLLESVDKDWLYRDFDIAQWELDSDDDDPRRCVIQTDSLMCYDGTQPLKKEIELWKKNELELYSTHITLMIVQAEITVPSYDYVRGLLEEESNK